jgi:purine-nucleoside phosphorylase
MDTYAGKIEQAVVFLRKQLKNDIRNAMILGSGMGAVADVVENRRVVPYSEIQGFPRLTVPGHRGELVYGQLQGKPVLIFSGRFHYYQGYSLQEVTLPVRVAARLGVENIIVTNACGGINQDFKPGDIMIIRDHINFMGSNPLMGIDTGEFGTSFIDMNEPYDRELGDRLRELASHHPEIGDLREGVYVAITGPSYETKAEISFLKSAGADAVGMSTVPEVIVCRQEGIKVIGISAVSNMAAGIQKRALSHQEVLDTTAKMSDRLILLIKELFEHVFT